MPAVNKHFASGAKRATIKLWRAKVPQKNIMKQLGMSRATVMRVLAFAMANPADPIAQQKKGSGHPTKQSVATFDLMMKKLEKNPTMTASQLKMWMTPSPIRRRGVVITPSVCCHLGLNEEEAGEESNTDSQPAEVEYDPVAYQKKVSGYLAKLSVATLDLMKKKLEKNPTLTASQMKMRMRIENGGWNTHY
jgi:uncharacterized protein YneF (UPF0154 family)